MEPTHVGWTTSLWFILGGQSVILQVVGHLRKGYLRRILTEYLRLKTRSHTQSPTVITAKHEGQFGHSTPIYNYITNSLGNKHSLRERRQNTNTMASHSLFILATAIILSAAFTAARGCKPSDRASLLAFRKALNEPYLGLFNSWSGANCCSGSWHGISCDATTGRVTDVNLRGESEDPIFVKSGRSGYMTGKLSPAICSIDTLTTLIVADWKAISGDIPPCLTALSSLRILDLIGNKLSGEIPADVGKLTRLTVLNLADNALTGKIPPSITHLSSLKHLDLSNNRLSGDIPENFGSLAMLSRALLSRNQLTGSIPVSVSRIYRLADLDLSANRLSGSIPFELGRMPVLSTLNLDSNNFMGLIPSSLLSNPGMGILNLSRNGFEGTIPDVFGSHSYFMALDLSYNNLKGRVPGSLSSAKFIGHLDLSHNHLCGSIPLGAPFDHLEASLFSYNDCLCGNPLKTC
ncbi:hypothetical protein Fmac_018422 [Flemingia macrophylla]|uniref:Leucine-rich repeat-containing N-terminal plant-type domain-containing protein n=1 Tax=Flemingia macrophylla TaxID=520843 RepID=A0ABD1M521_9FABA